MSPQQPHHTENTPLFIAFEDGHQKAATVDDYANEEGSSRETTSDDGEAAACTRKCAMTTTGAALLLLFGFIVSIIFSVAWQRTVPRKPPPDSLLMRDIDVPMLGATRGIPCDEIMVGVWVKTCLVHVGMTIDNLESEGMVSYIYVTLSDGSFAEIQNDGNGFMSMYGTYNYAPGSGASRTQNCMVKYSSYYKQDPIDNWLPAPGSFTYNTWEFTKDFFSNLPNSLSCHFVRIRGPDCRNMLSRLMSHLAGDGVSLSQYYNAARDLC